ncbi:MAG: 1-acyl-sn-glycerol-3-phosphate acyltransferase [Clostridia bacterium]|nr:1-acyl-sn-glycerol-3-phosphate acyltransferase [Clostridia bacterium]
MKLYRFLKGMLLGLIKFLFRIKASGRENEPKDGAYIICSNHISFADVILIGAVIKRPVRFLAKAELFKIPVLGSFFKAMGAFPIKRGTADVGAIKNSIKLLSQDEIVAVFIQGTRCSGIDVSKTEAKSGAAMIAYRTGVPVLPIYIDTKNNKLKLFSRNTVRIGKLITAEEMAFDGGNKGEYDRVTQMIFDRIIELSEEAKSEREGKG